MSSKPVTRQQIPNEERIIQLDKCYICGEEGADTYLMGVRVGPFHKRHAICPECGETDLVLWRTSPPHIFRCQNCLHKWEVKSNG